MALVNIATRHFSLSRITSYSACVQRTYSSYHQADETRRTIINIPKSSIYQFGASNASTPVFCDFGWTVNEGEAWAVVGSSSGEKGAVFQMILGHFLIKPSPPAPGMFPFLSVSPTPVDPYTRLSLVSFSHRPRTAGGDFYDYTARYGAVRDEDRITLRQSMFPEMIPEFVGPFAKEEEEKWRKEHGVAAGDDLGTLSPEERKRFDDLIDQMGLRESLDLPRVALSNGQTRRARIIKAILKKPEILLLDEPLTGLDVSSRPRLLSLLSSLHVSRSPRVILGLRRQDALPDWITHVALVQGNRVTTGAKEKVLSEAEAEDLYALSKYSSKLKQESGKDRKQGSLLVDMQGVNVRYGPRTVLNGINWQIRQGERWHLQGSNGSGKTTLLSLLTGDHPQSYIQSHLHLPAISTNDHVAPTYKTQHRKRIATPHLQRAIGVVSPELFDAFPRRHPGMTVWDAVGTGFDGGFVPHGKEGVGVIDDHLNEQQRRETIEWRLNRTWEVLEALGPSAWSRNSGTDLCTSKREITARFSKRFFSSLSPGEQRMVLLMRALVGRPPVVLLDEVWSGMDAGMVNAARSYLRGENEDGKYAIGENQAVIVITHWEEEVPWGANEGVKKFRLDQGVGTIVE
ncbi:P-loop containing nucleoside triphosphate hydrolase protein [Crucibulum laeve]|uniref:P-loop containing nucleoside triphosphate hydrolase protein n=1 Tax=Crucibulum laeve TaxID=68775 RepID=A0A5C3LLD8_9AGAR|nr:P-loop containing nucleoside triphosphate hydrolase protein [Crucibulum laeve]